MAMLDEYIENTFDSIQDEYAEKPEYWSRQHEINNAIANLKANLDLPQIDSLNAILNMIDNSYGITMRESFREGILRALSLKESFNR